MKFTIADKVAQASRLCGERASASGSSCKKIFKMSVRHESCGRRDACATLSREFFKP